jgi:hypothetical protein
MDGGTACPCGLAVEAKEGRAVDLLAKALEMNVTNQRKEEPV